MRTASKSLQIIALATCFTVHFVSHGHLSGIRRALQTMSNTSIQMLAIDAGAAREIAPFA
jgi:hypothetical protein